MIADLEVVRTIQSNERYDAYEAKLNGKKVFAKQAKSPKTKELLVGLPKNSEVVNRLGATTDFKFRAPGVLAQSGDFLVAEWIDGQPLSSEVANRPKDVADVLARFMAVFDKVPVDNEGFRQIFTPGGLARRMAERIPKNLTPAQQQVLIRAKQKFDELAPMLVPALQDADIKPDHIFPDPKKKGAYVLVDSEHLSPQWPRFYDLGNLFAKFWVRGQKAFSNTLLKDFVAESGVPAGQIFQPLTAILIVRAISIHWETDYDPGAKEYNIPRAQEMLEACLAANNLDDLLY